MQSLLIAPGLKLVVACEMATLYHATSEECARSIDRSQTLRCGTSGFAGGAIYFSSTPENAGRKSRVFATVIIRCMVELGRTLEVSPHMVTAQDVLRDGYNSVSIRGFDVFAVYDPWRVRIIEFQRAGQNRWFRSMDALLLCEQPQQQRQQDQHAQRGQNRGTGTSMNFLWLAGAVVALLAVARALR